MAGKTVDVVETGNRGGFVHTVLMDGPKFHTWILLMEAGQRDEMHCHNADETFYCVQGNGHIVYLDQPPAELKAGTVALIPGGQFYALDNSTATERMILLGNRALTYLADKTIIHATKQRHLWPGQDPLVDPPLPQGTSILV
ncbi:MAG: cupin domain-containing protein [Chloroflexi bacterium]|nr:cupin domain-containing protein [Chloroflexota bacterium]